MRLTDPHGAHRPVAGGLARASVFGVSDGLVSNVSLILGFAAGDAGADVVRLAGIAGAVAGAISMAAGEWVSVTAQNELTRREVAVERRELLHNPDSEKRELAEIYQSHGMDADHAAAAAAQVMRSPDRALGVHTREELGVDPDDLGSPVGAAVLSFVCFLFGAVLPLIPWLVGASGTAPTVASFLIGIVMATVVGAVIARLAERPIWWPMVRQAVIVVGACAVTFAVGQLFGVATA